MRPSFPLHLLVVVALASAAIAAEPTPISVPTAAPPRVTLSSPEPHPSRAHRFVVKTADGLGIEYSPGMEADVQAVADRVTAWNAEVAASFAREAAKPPLPPLPFSARHLREHNEEILQRIAAEIGLEAPSELQRACYDTFLHYYEVISDWEEIRAVVRNKMATFPRIEIWDRSDMVARLQAGEVIENFSYDPATDRINFALNFEFIGEPSPEEKAELETIKDQALDNAFNYTLKDGIASLSATFSLPRWKRPTAIAPRNRVPNSLELQEQMKDFSWSLPLMRTKENAGKTPEEFVEESFRPDRNLARPRGSDRSYRDGSLALVVLHETIEAGIVERYIGSRDRRWLCDGAANFLAWKIARDLDPGYVQEIYDLDRQLARYASLQPRINLRKWPAVEYQREADRDTDLTRAHYAFATRAFHVMAEKHGEDSILSLFREIGRTPRQKVSMKTVAQAYAKATGDTLGALLDTAQRAPLPPNASDPSQAQAIRPTPTAGN